MSMSRCSCCEVSVRISTEDGSQKYTHKALCYEPLTLSLDCVPLVQIVEEAKAAFKGCADEITITLKSNW